MPRVERDAEVTLVVLVYRSLKWLDWCMEGVDSSKQETRYRWLVVANDATEEVRRDPRISLDYQNSDPSEPYINRVYRAWNEGVLNSPTEWCVLLNSDMYCTDYAIDELMRGRKMDYDGLNRQPTLPCGLLVEHGRIPSGMPEYVKDFGTNPENFRKQELLALAAQMRDDMDKTTEGGKYPVHDSDRYEPGRLFQPVLFNRQEFLDMGGYPEGNVNGVSGDKILFDRYVEAGFQWVTCKGSVWYHCQEGETRWP
jgi:hypothetical protein